MTAAREAIAYHEAGHAVISMKLGYKCLYVTIIPDGNRLGHVCCEDPMAGGHDDKIKHALKVLLAASLAESKLTRTWGDADDRLKATNLALLATDRDTQQAEALINEMIGEARKLVEQHWPDIEKLAERLLIEGRVNFFETKAGASEDFAPRAAQSLGSTDQSWPSRNRRLPALRGHRSMRAEPRSPLASRRAWGGKPAALPPPAKFRPAPCRNQATPPAAKHPTAITGLGQMSQFGTKRRCSVVALPTSTALTLQQCLR